MWKSQTEVAIDAHRHHKNTEMLIQSTKQDSLKNNEVYFYSDQDLITMAITKKHKTIVKMLCTSMQNLSSEVEPLKLP